MSQLITSSSEKGMGAHAARASNASELRAALEEARSKTDRPTVIHLLIDRQNLICLTDSEGWWDIPRPSLDANGNETELRKEYLASKAKQIILSSRTFVFSFWTNFDGEMPAVPLRVFPTPRFKTRLRSPKRNQCLVENRGAVESNGNSDCLVEAVRLGDRLGSVNLRRALNPRQRSTMHLSGGI